MQTLCINATKTELMAINPALDCSTADGFELFQLVSHSVRGLETWEYSANSSFFEGGC
jgi:hypothetical protein